MQTEHFCAVKGRKTNADMCPKIIWNADAATIEVCRACARGKALVSTAITWAPALPPPPPKVQPPAAKPAISAWAIVRQVTGLKTYGKLVATLGGFTVAAVRKQMLQLDAGKLPRSDNKLLPALLSHTGLTLNQLRGLEPLATINQQPAQGGEA